MIRRVLLSVLILVAQPLSLSSFIVSAAEASANGPIVVINIDGPINPATDDFLKTSMEKAIELDARLFVIKLNTPGGLLPSMQSMVEQLLESKIPTVVYVSPRGGGAISAGVFITMAGHVAAMAPGTTIGAAHPVAGDGQDIQGDMREKIENFAVTHLRAIADERGRNMEWAEKAVRESVAITAKEAQEEKVVDLVVGDMDSLLAEIEGKTVQVAGEPVTLVNLKEAPIKQIDMTFRQIVINILSDPNIAVLLGLGAVLGIGLELYHPGSILPGVLGAICLVLSLISAQVLPINYGGAILIVLGFTLFLVEMLTPSFGIWGGGGIVCLVLGSIYLIDNEFVWSGAGFEVDRILLASVAATFGMILLACSYMGMRVFGKQVTTGQKGMIGEIAEVKSKFEFDENENISQGTVFVRGELWSAKAAGDLSLLPEGSKLEVTGAEGLCLNVKEKNNQQS